MKQRIAKVKNHIKENKETYATILVGGVVGGLLGVIYYQNKIIKEPVRLSMKTEDFKRMVEEGGRMVWDETKLHRDVILRRTEDLEKGLSA